MPDVSKPWRQSQSQKDAMSVPKLWSITKWVWRTNIFRDNASEHNRLRSPFQSSRLVTSQSALSFCVWINLEVDVVLMRRCCRMQQVQRCRQEKRAISLWEKPEYYSCGTDWCSLVMERHSAQRKTSRMWLASGSRRWYVAFALVEGNYRECPADGRRHTSIARVLFLQLCIFHNEWWCDICSNTWPTSS